MRYRKISYSSAEHTATIKLLAHGDEPTIGEDMAEEIRACCQELTLSDEIRVVMLSGSGERFAVGRATPPPETCEAPMTERLAWQSAMGAASAIAELPMPVIAVLNGDAMAHGLELALAADLRVASEAARLGVGNLMSDGFPYDGATQRLPRLVGPALARDMLLTGRTLTAAEALEAGLVNRVAPAKELAAAAKELADNIAGAAPIAARYAKEAVQAAGDCTLAQGLRLEADLSVILQSTADRSEGLRSFAERRAPHFTGH
jgi:enoyl-CoA hydratase/carnithine racemase